MERRDYAGDDPRGGRPAERIEQAGREGAAAVREEARSTLERGKSSAAGAAGDVSEAFDEAASSLASQGRDSLAQAAGMLSTQLSSLAQALENRSVDDLLRQARRVARENPALFTAGGVAVGIALARFFRASPAEAEQPSSAAGRRPPTRAEETPGNVGGPGAAGVTPRYGVHGSASEPSTADNVGGRYD